MCVLVPWGHSQIDKGAVLILHQQGLLQRVRNKVVGRSVKSSKSLHGVSDRKIAQALHQYAECTCTSREQLYSRTRSRHSTRQLSARYRKKTLPLPRLHLPSCVRFSKPSDSPSAACACLHFNVHDPHPIISISVIMLPTAATPASRPRASICDSGRRIRGSGSWQKSLNIHVLTAGRLAAAPSRFEIFDVASRLSRIRHSDANC
jgi:hypothetical protein